MAEQSCPQGAAEVAAHRRSASECQLAPSGFGSSRHTVVEVEPELDHLGRPQRTLPSRCQTHRRPRMDLLRDSARSKLPKLHSAAVARA